MNDFQISLSKSWHLVAVSVLLMFAIGAFIKQFLIAGIKTGGDLQRAIQSLQEISSSTSDQSIKLEEIQRFAGSSFVLAHQWNEYRETLHRQVTVSSDGSEQVVRWRATAMASTFFTEQALVNTPLKAEFYKHLPGILTGIGILGTFFGLISGLKNFNASSENPAVIRQSLNDLIHNVGEAFVVSAFAIGSAMVITWVEKHIVTKRYRQVEEICHIIDGLFDAGAGEEYLARLVKASESSATQAAQIKDALVADLRELLSELTAKQVESSIQSNRDMAGNLANTLAASISEPMQRISQAVERVGGNQGDAVNKLLTDVLVNFSSQMQDMFGGQLKGTSELMQQAMQSMQLTAGRFEELAATLQSAGQGAAGAMADQLTRAITAMETRQQLMNTQMSTFAEQFKVAVNDSHSETNKKLHSMLADLGERVSQSVTVLQNQSESAAREHGKRESEFQMHSTATTDQLSAQVQTLGQQLTLAAETMRVSVASLSQTSQLSIERMNSGAELLYAASTDFSKAGNTVGGTLQAAAMINEKMSVVANSLLGASKSTQNVLEDYKAARDTFALIVSELKTTVENARREASLTSELVGSMKGSADQLRESQKQADEYLNGISEVLTRAHEDFAQNMSKTLDVGNAQFHKELSNAVSLLKTAILDFGTAVETLTPERV